MKLTQTLQRCTEVEIYKPHPEGGTGEVVVTVQAGTAAATGSVQVGSHNGTVGVTNVPIGTGMAVGVKASKTVTLHLLDGGPAQLVVEYEVTR